MPQHLETLRASGQNIGLSYWLSLVAESEAARGEYEQAIARLDECLQYAEATGEMYYVSELHRMKGAWITHRDPGAMAEAEACYHRALLAAHERSTRMSGLRSALALARILQTRGEAAEAAEVLRPLVIQSTEGLDRPELREARTLLEELDSVGTATSRDQEKMNE